MNVLFFAIPVALVISLGAVITFVYLVQSGQFDDLETPPRRMLFDDVERMGSPHSADSTSADDSEIQGEVKHEN